MKGKPVKIRATAFMTLLLILLGAGSSHAWFIAVNQGADESAMGTVDITISGQTEVTEGILPFTITNHSQIDTYMRLGWTPIIYQNGLMSVKDVSGVVVVKVEPDGDGHPNGLQYSTGQITSRNGYQKNVILMEDSDGKYFVVPADTDISGVISVDGWRGNDHEALHLILIPEAIQATGKAVEAADTHGWHTGFVGSQASTIVSPIYDGQPNQGGGDS